MFRFEACASYKALRPRLNNRYSVVQTCLDLAMSAVHRESTAAQMRRVLSERILSGELIPGTRLREMQLASEFEISQESVREALRELEVLGLTQTEAYKGTHVRDVTKKDLREVYLVRSALEKLAGRLAAPSLKAQCCAS